MLIICKQMQTVSSLNGQSRKYNSLEILRKKLDDYGKKSIPR
jgi:hypothetical protein